MAIALAVTGCPAAVSSAALACSLRVSENTVAPATYNTINRLALGLSDTYALGILAEAVSLPIPVVMLPFVNTALASRRPFLQAVDLLRVRILLGPGGIEPHPPGTGGGQLAAFPWGLALHEAERLAHSR